MKTERSWPFSFFLHLLYYFALASLIFMLIYPYTAYFYDSPFFIPYSQRLNHHDIVLEKGETVRLYPLSLHKRITYSSEDFKVAEVNNTGLVKALRTGVTVIKVKMDNAETKCRIRVVSLNYKSAVIAEGEDIRLKVTGKSGRITWKSDNKNVASVNRKGQVTGIKEGTASIRASCKGKVLNCEIHVHKKETGL